MVKDLTSLNFPAWLAANRDLSGTKCHVFEGSEFWAFIAVGPNDRTVFHVNPADELFHQLEGDMELHYMNARGERQMTVLVAGDVLVVPAGVPHSPRRGAGSRTWVLTLKRNRDTEEGWIWYCDRCHAILHEVKMRGRQVGDPVEVRTGGVRLLRENPEMRTCTRCGHRSDI
jgi:3-hydroxyanthranilate 3,4-dioxygenase